MLSCNHYHIPLSTQWDTRAFNTARTPKAAGTPILPQFRSSCTPGFDVGAFAHVVLHMP